MLVREERFAATNANSTSGAIPPYPIRKKSLYRALKRSDLGPILLKNFQELKDGLIFNGIKFKEIYPDPYCPDNQGYIRWPLK